MAVPEADRPASGSGGRSQARYTRETSFVESSDFSHIPPENLAVGGRLKYFVGKWSEIRSDKWIMDTIAGGLVLEFVTLSVQDDLCPSVEMNAKIRKVCRAEVESLLLKRAILEVSERNEGFVSSIFVNKKSGGYRPIVNLKASNNLFGMSVSKWKILKRSRALLEWVTG